MGSKKQNTKKCTMHTCGNYNTKYETRCRAFSDLTGSGCTCNEICCGYRTTEEEIMFMELLRMQQNKEIGLAYDNLNTKYMQTKRKRTAERKIRI